MVVIMFSARCFTRRARLTHLPSPSFNCVHRFPITPHNFHPSVSACVCVCVCSYVFVFVSQCDSWGRGWDEIKPETSVGLVLLLNREWVHVLMLNFSGWEKLNLTPLFLPRY